LKDRERKENGRRERDTLEESSLGARGYTETLCGAVLSKDVGLFIERN
jgi:hypothetical protein